MRFAMGASDQNFDSLTFSAGLGHFTILTRSSLFEAKEGGNFTTSTFCVPLTTLRCQPVERNTTAVNNAPMSNDFMSMDFILGKTYES